jgi:AhpD family alkylhydroperoxidase
MHNHCIEEALLEPRIDARKFAPDAGKTMMALEKYLGECGLDHKLMHLLKTRASQINGCAYCIDMHSKDARALGETEQRLYELDAWRETPFYSDRERAALAWIEAVTLVSQTHVPDAVYEDVRKQFSEKEIVDLTYLAATINAWNRLAIALRAVPGHYKPAASSAAAS